MHAWKEEPGSCFNDLPPFTCGARCVQVWQSFQLPGQIGEEGDEVAEDAILKRRRRQAQGWHRRCYPLLR